MDAKDKANSKKAAAGSSRAVPAPSLMVKRGRLLRDLAIHGTDAGISIVCAPDGLGKTALLIQYVAEVRDDPSRGMACLLDAGGMSPGELVRKVRETGRGLETSVRPLIAIDNIPQMGPKTLEVMVPMLRQMREEGVEVIVSCTPENRPFVNLMSDSFKIGAQAMKIHPKEYPVWVRTFSISTSVDVYGLTQGVPSLVTLLQTLTDKRNTEALDRGIAELYRAVLTGMRRNRDGLYRIACLMVLMGGGAMTDLERCGVRVKADTLTRLARDYPIFGYDTETRTFSSMGGDAPAIDRVRAEIAKKRPQAVPQAVRILMSAGRVDRAVRLADLLMDVQGRLQTIGMYPTSFALSGNAPFVHRVVSGLKGEDAVKIHPGVLLAVYLTALVSGEYRLARAMASELRRRASEVEHEVDASSWKVACALSDIWRDCAGIELPIMPDAYIEEGGAPVEELALRSHAARYRALMTSASGPADLEAGVSRPPYIAESGIDVAGVLLECDGMLEAALYGEIPDFPEREAALEALARELASRRLTPVAARVRMTTATCRLMAGMPVVDERAFGDAGTVAVRESDLPTQLFCLLGEGWQAIDKNQIVNARFRAQQVLKLADEEKGILRSWGTMLERTAYLLNTSRVTAREEAEGIDLSSEECAAHRAWAVALHLSSIRYDSELSAWFSVHKATLLDERVAPIARQAMRAIGTRADSVRRLIPSRLANRYALGEREPERRACLFDAGIVPSVEAGSIEINLFGGLRVERDGHVVTDDAWKRKKAGVLAARLVLALDSFVNKRMLSEEMWPESEFVRARDNLYVAVSALRDALGQRDMGPRYLLTQGEGITLNSEFISSDTRRFDMLARGILLKSADTSGREAIEACLKVEQLYTGPLFVPDSGNGGFFESMRRSYQSRFVDCMVRGSGIAADNEDLSTASWLIEAALRNAPLREDAIRQAMRIYDLSGRKREIVELYNAHLHYLEQQFRALPDEETKIAYESIMGRTKMIEFL